MSRVSSVSRGKSKKSTSEKKLKKREINLGFDQKEEKKYDFFFLNGKKGKSQQKERERERRRNPGVRPLQSYLHSEETRRCGCAVVRSSRFLCLDIELCVKS